MASNCADAPETRDSPAVRSARPIATFRRMRAPRYWSFVEVSRRRVDVVAEDWITALTILRARAP